MSDRELSGFLHIARGSAAELEYHLLLSHDLGFLSQQDHKLLSLQTDEVQRTLTSLVRRIQPLTAKEETKVSTKDVELNRS